MHDHVDSSPKLVQDLIHNEIKTLEMLFSMNHYGFFQCLYCLHGTDVQGNIVIVINKFNIIHLKYCFSY